jgi:hypothetical protein
MKTILRMTGLQHEKIKMHLFPGDGFEAVVIAVCGRSRGNDRNILMVREIHPIPYEDCSARTPVNVTWSTEKLVPLLEKASRENSAILKIHSHPGGYPKFSRIDDVSDKDLFSSVYGWFDGEDFHASCVMLPDGSIFGRLVKIDGEFEDISKISVAGNNIYYWNSRKDKNKVPEFARRHAQAFGAGTFNLLSDLSVAVVGCSGTGSPVIEQLARLGVGQLVLIDPDCVEEKNLNRILNTFEEDAENRDFKVDVLAQAVEKMGTGTEVIPLPLNLYSPEAVKAVAGCDMIFGCMDGVEGRHLLNRLAVFYNIPYIDVGVRLIADDDGGVEQICGSVHYLQPDRSSLLSRGLYTLQKLYSESLKRTNPAEYEKQLKEKYISGVQEDRPAVISVNMQFAAMAVNEFLARIHQFRDDGNENYAVTTMSLTQAVTYFEEEGKPCRVLSRHVGKGDITPLLDMPELSELNNVLPVEAKV